jgi:hypothetical protein
LEYRVFAPSDDIGLFNSALSLLVTSSTALHHLLAMVFLVESMLLCRNNHAEIAFMIGLQPSLCMRVMRQGKWKIKLFSFATVKNI